MNTNLSQTTTAAEVIDLEGACEFYRQRRDGLRELATLANDALEQIKRQHLPALRTALAQVAEAEASLRDAVRDAPADLWRRARSRVIHGVKVGWQKARGKVTFDDEQKVIDRIRRLLPTVQAELLIRVRESVHKPAVYDLTAGDLRRLGITVEDDCDQVVVKDLESELDRALEALLVDIAELDA